MNKMNKMNKMNIHIHTQAYYMHGHIMGQYTAQMVEYSQNSQFEYNKQMGGQCSSSRHHSKDDYELVGESTHPTFGHIARLRTTNKLAHTYRHDIAAKTYSFPDHSAYQSYLQYLSNAHAYHTIPTLITVFSWDQEDPLKKAPMFGTTCSPTFKVKLYFHHHEHNLHQVLVHKKQEIVAFKAKQTAVSKAKQTGVSKSKQTIASRANYNPRNSKTNSNQSQTSTWLLPEDLKLDNYQQIDQLPPLLRKTVNLYYQEVEILRMIDHIVGALYFLNHVQHANEAVRPNTIMVDEQGKFVLVDAMVFRMDTNYEIGLSQHGHKHHGHDQHGYDQHGYDQNDPQILKYLSPQLLAHVKAGHLEHQEDSAKAEIFSVGIIALHMCLLDNFDHCSIWDNFRVDRNQLTKVLLQVRTRYSPELVDLLREMLQYDPLKRIGYSALIDQLNPLLSANMDKIQKLYTDNNTLQDINSSVMSLSGRCQEDAYSNQLMRKLGELETRYQKVLNGRVMYEERLKVDQRSVKEDEKMILKQLSRLGRESKEQTASKREVRGSELYEIYLNEYQSIKKNRVR